MQIQEPRRITRKPALLMVSAFFAVAMGLFPLLESYLTNIHEFWFSVQHILPGGIAVTVLLALFVFGVGYFLPDKPRSLWIALFSHWVWLFICREAL